MLRNAEQRSWLDLAIFEGKPLFPQPLHVNTPNVASRSRLFELIGGMLDRRWLSDGFLVRSFEEQVERLLGVRHCIATCNGTIALEIAARSMTLEGEVIVPSFTFASTVQALTWLNLKPVFCDVNARTHTIDPNIVESLITPRTSAILGVHLWGLPCDIAGLTDVARHHRLMLFFDAAHAFGNTWRGRMIGGFGSAEAFSFHATKFVNTAEGGAITTNDDDLASRMRASRDVGFDSHDRIVGLGTNGKMSEICAAFGVASLESFNELLGASQASYRRYRMGLAGLPGISLLEMDGAESRNCQYIVTEVDESVCRISRDDVLRVLQAENILAKRYFYPGCHRMDYYSTKGQNASNLPVTETLLRRVLVLPGGASIDAESIDAVCATLRLVLNHGSEIRQALANCHTSGHF